MPACCKPALTIAGCSCSCLDGQCPGSRWLSSGPDIALSQKACLLVSYRPLARDSLLFSRARRRRIANRSSDSERARPGSLCPHEHAHEISRPLVGGSPQFSRQNPMDKATRKPTAKKTPPSGRATRLKKDAARAKAAADPFAAPGSARATLTALRNNCTPAARLGLGTAVWCWQSSLEGADG